MRSVCVLALSLLVLAPPAAANHPYQDMMTASNDITGIQVTGNWGCPTPGIEPMPPKEQIALSKEAESEKANCKSTTIQALANALYESVVLAFWSLAACGCSV
jgi:hypothetical protein